MKLDWKASAFVLAAMLGAAAPAGAQSLGLSIGPGGGIAFSFDSGGYCDRFGCPDAFWDLPVYYGPVFYRGEWYRGPVYYRMRRGGRQYWIQGNWRNDEWRGPRPDWAREGRYGPALGMDYYRSHGFHGRWDQDRQMGQRGGNWQGNQDDQRFDRHDNGAGNFGQRGNGYNGPGQAQGGGVPDNRGFNGGMGYQGNAGGRQGFDQRGNTNAGPAINNNTVTNNNAVHNNQQGGAAGAQGNTQAGGAFSNSPEAHRRSGFLGNGQNQGVQQTPPVQTGVKPAIVAQPAPAAQPAPPAPTPPAPATTQASPSGQGGQGAQGNGGNEHHRGPRGDQPNPQ